MKYVCRLRLVVLEAWRKASSFESPTDLYERPSSRSSSLPPPTEVKTSASETMVRSYETRPKSACRSIFSSSASKKGENLETASEGRSTTVVDPAVFGLAESSASRRARAPTRARTNASNDRCRSSSARPARGSHCSTKRYPVPSVVLRKLAEPQHLSLPRAKMPMRSPRTSASSMYCVVSRMVRPLFAEPRKSQRSRRARASMPAVGSSRSTNLDWPHSARAAASLRRLPPESSAETASASLFKSKCVSSSAASTRADAEAPFILAKSSKCSLAVSLPNKTSFCGHRPVSLRISAISSRMRMP
mmetsp:Transcript_8802/g.29008  ORF Transcript_8802/g.29008 Transcript_8802/m.29008 type:complete len:304 (-) Transcript_8802:1295-2206(-)